MSRPLLLDLFCGAGGAAMGYHRAGFDVVGIDLQPQPRYPFRFVQGDALKALEQLGRRGSIKVQQAEGGSVEVGGVAAVHASPPCQAHSALRTSWNAKPHPSLIEPTRHLLQQGQLPYIIENVMGAPLHQPIRLCGTSFDLGTGDAELRRHRLFEASCALTALSCRHGTRVIGVYGGHGRDRRRTIGVFGGGHGESSRNKERGARNYSAAEQREAMGIAWMTVDELSQAIPPAYTEYLGRQLLAHLQREAVA